MFSYNLRKLLLLFSWPVWVEIIRKFLSYRSLPFFIPFISFYNFQVHAFLFCPSLPYSILFLFSFRWFTSVLLVSIPFFLHLLHRHMYILHIDGFSLCSRLHGFPIFFLSIFLFIYSFTSFSSPSFVCIPSYLSMHPSSLTILFSRLPPSLPFTLLHLYTSLHTSYQSYS